MDTIKDNRTGISVHGHKINNLKLADDIDLLEEERNALQENLKRLNEALGLMINIQKAMTMVFGQDNIIEELMINSTRIENVTELWTLVAYSRRTTTAVRGGVLGGGLHEQLEWWPDSRKCGIVCTSAYERNSAL